ncbi:MAG: MFS transporter [Pseudomonadota bacterium]|jgi:DHA2 family methylenomycin A resistance protein-like MFS transporter|uniref:MFS transporter n=3 Tax=Burkholderiales TaxID=80840 RepID=UPI0010F4F642|nr:MFS transporter [Burkholderia sp. 4M9327F10]
MSETPTAFATAGAKNTMRMWQLVLLMAATSLGYFVVQLDVSIVNLSLPAIQHYFQIDVAMLQWIVNSYTLSFSVVLLSAGVLGDRYGSKNFLLLGYAVFCAASLACGMAPTVPTMLLARFVQGIGAAIIVPNSLAVINWALPDNKSLRLTLVSIWMAFGGAALTSGPIFGGIINSIANWRYIFFINLPICALGVFLTARHVKATPRRDARSQDWIGQLLLLCFATALLVLIINFAELSRDARLALAAAAVVSLAIFIRVEKRSQDPAIPLDIFRNVGLQKVFLIAVMVNFVYFGVVFFSSLYFRHYLKMTVLQAGLAFIPVTLPLIVSNLLSARISRTYGPERSIAIGFWLMIPGLLYLALPALRTSYGLMLPAFAVTTFGIGFISSTITAMAMNSIGPERGGMISAVVNFFRQIAGAFGVAVFGIFMTSADRETAYRHFGVALVSVALVLLLSIAVFARLERSRSATFPLAAPRRASHRRWFWH